MDKNQYIPIVAAIVAVIIVAAAAVYVLNNDDDDQETYYFYISSDDATISGWHSAEGDDAADAFANAMKADNIDYEIGSSGYLSKIGKNEGYWFSAMYLYGNTSELAAKASVSTVVTDQYGYYSSSNGWKTICGYEDTGRTGDKLWEMNGNIFFFSMYGSETPNPTTDTKWMNDGPFKSTISLKGSNETYYFYISSEDKTISGWHSAQGKDAADAFANAMKADNIDYEIGSSGYLSKIGKNEGYWFSAMYLYGNTSELAAKASVSTVVTDQYGYYVSSNGWNAIYGYDDSGRAGDKLWEMNGNMFFFSMYGSETPNPTTDNSWSTTGPFAA